MDARDSRVHNYPPRWNGAPSQDLLVIRRIINRIRRNHQSGAVSLDPLRWGLIPHQCQDPKGGRKPINSKRETVVMSALTGSRHWSAGNSVVMGQQETLRFTLAILANAPRVA